MGRPSTWSPLRILGALAICVGAGVATGIGEGYQWGLASFGVAVLFLVLVLTWSHAPAWGGDVRDVFTRRADERQHGIALRSLAVAGFAMMVASLVAMAVEFARGHASGAPFAQLCAVYAVVYLATLFILSRRG